MNIIITTEQVPFVTGGAELHARNLKNALIAAGHKAEIVAMTFSAASIEKVEDHIVAARLLDQEWSWGGHVDLCIGLKFPAYLMPHPNKIVWMLHQYRAVYDLFDTEFSSVKNDPYGRRLRQVIKNADDTYLAEAKRIYTNSPVVSARLKRFNGYDSQPLYHPCPDMELYFPDKYENYILMPSRINITKRQKLALEAMCCSRTDIKLYIVGKSATKEETEQLFDFVKEHKMESRVRFLDYVSVEEKLRLYANARAVLFIPYDEDYGYITLEGMASGKAVITAEDSGGPLGFVRDGQTGFVCKPEAHALAETIDRLAEDRNLAIRLGESGKKRLTDMNISWEHVVEELTKK